MQWELRGDRPIYQQLVEKLTEQIVSGQLSAGEKVPPVRELAAQALRYGLAAISGGDIVDFEWKGLSNVHRKTEYQHLRQAE